jgi:hypothetical protein
MLVIVNEYNNVVLIHCYMRNRMHSPNIKLVIVLVQPDSSVSLINFIFLLYLANLLLLMCKQCREVGQGITIQYNLCLLICPRHNVANCSQSSSLNL